MGVNRTRFTVTVAGMLLAAAACASAPGGAPAAVPTPGDAAATGELEALYWSRQDSARTRFGEADVHFVTGMIGHHAQALEMARLAPTRGASRSVQTLAARIFNAQQDEIALMQQWLRDRGQPVPEPHVPASRSEHNGPGHEVHMPGMLTADELRRLDRARGREFDRLFLTFMIQHHRGAVTMVEELIATDAAAQDPAVFKLASDIQVDQVTEIARMELMLAQLSAAEGPP